MSRLAFQQLVVTGQARGQLGQGHERPRWRANRFADLQRAPLARLTVASFPANRIQAQLEVFDWLVTRNNPKVSRNPPGFLIASIKAEYAPPRDYVSRQEQQAHESQIAERKRRAEERAKQRTAREQAQQLAKESAIQKFWQSLSDEERQRMETDALSEASTLQRELIEHGGSLAEAARKTVFDAYALRILQQGA